MSSGPSLRRPSTPETRNGPTRSDVRPVPPPACPDWSTDSQAGQDWLAALPDLIAERLPAGRHAPVLMGMCDHGEMSVRSVHDRAELAELLGRDPALHAYELGDLDDFFWPYTIWYRNGDSVALLYHGAGLPILLALDRPEQVDRVVELLEGLLPLLPRRFYAHLCPGAELALAKHFQAEPHGPHLKMALTAPSRLDRVEPAGETLTEADLPELTAFYDLAYPAHQFDRRMLETGPYVGIRRDGELLAVAGVHIWSPRYQVGAIGNVTVHPRTRNQGLATVATAEVCRRLLATVPHITLNVRADNAAALAVYTRLGFTPVGEYTEIMFTDQS